MLEDGIDAGARAAWSAVSPRLMAELALPALVAGFLAIGVAPHSHGAERLATMAAILAVAAYAALNAVRTRRAQAGMVGALEAIDGASRAAGAVLAAVEQDAVPALEKLIAAAGAVASDRRVSASVRSRLAPIQASAEQALSILDAVVRPPVAERAEAPPIMDAPSFAAASRSPSEQPLRVLAAEANGVHQLVLRTLLAQVGMEAEFVASRVELIEAWRREDWDLILMDMEAPEIDGPAAARTIRSVEMKFGWVGTPIVAMAANPTARKMADYAEAGMDACVAKPIVGTSLFAAIETAMAPAAPVMLDYAEVA
jgi:CheY-like chemotaxis protein